MGRSLAKPRQRVNPDFAARCRVDAARIVTGFGRPFMLDRALIALLKPTLQRLAAGLVRARVGADAVTLAGFGLGMCAALAIAWAEPLWGLALVAASRLCDGLDGAVARLTRPTDRGAFLDITLDFLFYASVPLAFAVADPANALPAAVLLAAFIGTGSSFLAFALLAALVIPTSNWAAIWTCVWSTNSMTYPKARNAIKKQRKSRQKLLN